MSDGKIVRMTIELEVWVDTENEDQARRFAEEKISVTLDGDPKLWAFDADIQDEHKEIDEVEDA